MTKKVYSLKACPIVVREKGNTTEILAFHHPQAGKQVVKGTIEEGEDPAMAALRELEEESGITEAEIDRFLRVTSFDEDEQTWHIYLCKVTESRESWTHIAQEGDGNDYAFRFFWQDLTVEPGEGWDSTFREVLSMVREDLMV